MLKNKDLFILKKSSNKKVIGSDYPQCVGLSKAYSIDSLDSIEEFSNYKGKKPPFIPNLNGIVLDKKANLTDVISCSLGPGNDLIISEKLKSLLKDFNCGPAEYYDCSLVQNHKPVGKYNWQHFTYELEGAVDYSRSIFAIADEKLPKFLDRRSFEKYITKHDPFGFVRAISLELIHDYTGKLDLFMIGSFDQNIYISKKLKEMLLAKKITGIEILQIKG